MPRLFRRKEAVEGLDDLPTEDEAGSSMTGGSNPASPTSEEFKQLRTPRARARTPTTKQHLASVTREIQLKRAEERRNQMKFEQALSEHSHVNDDKIKSLLGVDDKGCCLRHPLFLIRSGRIEKGDRFESIFECKLCRQDSLQAQESFGFKGYYRERIVDITGQVKQLYKNQRQWANSHNMGFFTSSSTDKDGFWKEQASLRLDQVLSWNIDNAPLKSSPKYAKYFRMIADGVDIGAIKQVCEVEELDPRLLDFDPDRPLKVQLEESQDISQAHKEDIMFSVSGKGSAPEGLEEAVNELHDIYAENLMPTVTEPVSSKSLASTIFSNSANRKESTKQSPPPKPVVAKPVMAKPVVVTGRPVLDAPIQATPVSPKKQKNKSRFRFFRRNTEEELEKKVKAQIAEEERQEQKEQREREKQEKWVEKEREKKGKRQGTRSVNRFTMIILGTDQNRTDKLQRVREELEEINDQLLHTKQIIGEKNLRGVELIAKIQSLQTEINERSKYIRALETRIDLVKQERGIPASGGPSGRDDTTITDDSNAFNELYADKDFSDSKNDSNRSLSAASIAEGSTSQLPNNVISIDDKIEVDKVDMTDTGKRQRRRKMKNRRSVASMASKRSAASRRTQNSQYPTDREPNFDPEFLQEKFKESIRKLITINRFFQQANDIAMSKELDVDKKSMGAKSMLVDFVMPELPQDDEWEYYDIEEELTGPDSIPPPPGSLFNNLPMMSPQINHGRKSVMMKKSLSTRILSPPPVNPNSTVRWKDEKLHTVRCIPRTPPELFYTMEEIKLFRFEKFMDDNANQFEVVEDEDWEEEEIIEDDEYSYLSYDDESYLDDEEEFGVLTEQVEESTGIPNVVGSKPRSWNYNEDPFLLEDESPVTTTKTQSVTNPDGASEDNSLKNLDTLGISGSSNRLEQTTQSDRGLHTQAKYDSVDGSIFRERAASDAGISNNNTDRSVQSAGSILDDLIDQVDALIKRKTSDIELENSLSKDGAPPSPAEADKGALENDKRSLPELKNIEVPKKEGRALLEGSERSWRLSLADDHVMELRRTFHAFDTDGSGYIEADELKANLKRVGYDISGEGIGNLLSMVKSKDGKINFEQFITWNRVLWEEDVEEKFKAIDTKNKGYIDKSQLKDYLVDMGFSFTDEDLDELCYEMDTNADDKIFLRDFINVMASSSAGNSNYIVKGELYIEKLKSDFVSMDVDNSGYITKENMQAMAETSDCIFSPNELDQVMKETDLNGDGQISMDEFIAVCVAIKEPPSTVENSSISSNIRGSLHKKNEETAGNKIPSSSLSEGSDTLYHRLSEMSFRSIGKLETVMEAANEYESFSILPTQDDPTASQNLQKSDSDVDTKKSLNGQVENIEAPNKRQMLSDSEKSIEMSKNPEASTTKQGEAPSTTPESVTITAEIPPSATAPNAKTDTAEEEEKQIVEIRVDQVDLATRISGITVDANFKSAISAIGHNSKTSISASADWSSDDETEHEGTPRNITRKDNCNASSNIPLISIDDKLEVDKKAEVTSSKRRRRKRKSKRSQRESNLDPAFLRASFKERVKKLITLNVFFQQANESMFEKEASLDRKSFGGGKGPSLLSGMDESDMMELEDVFKSDETSNLSSVQSNPTILSSVRNNPTNLSSEGSMVSSQNPFNRGMDRRESAMSVLSVSSHAPPALSVQPQKSAIRSKEQNNGQRAKKSVAFRPDKRLHQVKFIPFWSEEQSKELFWTGEEMKLFRFEKFMQENADEFELVDDDDDEYEDEYEEISLVSGDDMSFDEETLEESARYSAADDSLNGRKSL